MICLPAKEEWEASDSSWMHQSTIVIIGSYYDGFAQGSFTAGSGTADGFGNFSLTIDNFDGWGHAAKSVYFTLTATPGTWLTASDVLTPNAGGSIAAAHIYVGDLTPNVTEGAFMTGYAANGGPPTPVPVPSALLLLGTGLVATAGMARRRLRNS